MPEGGKNFGNSAVENTFVRKRSSGQSEQSDMPGLVQSGGSSENLHEMAAEGLPLSPADRKRNKLGYHRTAVACGQLSTRLDQQISDNP